MKDLRLESAGGLALDELGSVITRLIERIDELEGKNDDLEMEIKDLEEEIDRLKYS